MAKPVVKRQYTLTERIYLWEILKGLRLTWKHFVFNFKESLKKGPHTVPTCWQYPWDRREISPVFRGEHMLTLDDQGREKCIGCGMCAKTCPAQCITVKRGKVPEGEEDKYAAKTYCERFEIDLLRCIFCGFCEEACPKGAIVLGQGYELADYTREACMANKERLMNNYFRAREEGTLKPPRKPVPRVKPPKKDTPTKKAAGGAEKGGAKKVVSKAKKAKGDSPKKKGEEA